MDDLDDIKAIQAIDTQFCLSSIKYLSDQCKASWNDIKSLDFPENYKDFSSVVFCGMGGSAYGGRMIKSLYSDVLPIPVEVVSDYHLPKYVGENTLIIAASYSGNTEETISCIMEALEFNAKIIGISSGGKLSEILKSNQKPQYIFKPVFNPSRQPRLGQGYMQMGQLAILNKLKILDIKEEDINILFRKLEENLDKLGVDNFYEKNTAKQMAFLFRDKIVNIIGAEFLEGAIHAIRNPFHETGKHFANYFILPEANHHLMEGLRFPSFNKKNLLFLILKSKLYSREIQKRLLLTKEVIEKNNIVTSEFELGFSDRLGQAFELIQTGSFITFYLAILHNVNPVEIPWVDYFKNKLKEGQYEK